MATAAQTIVARTSRMSIAASRLLCRPNCKGVKAKLNPRLSKKGSNIIKGIEPFAYL